MPKNIRKEYNGKELIKACAKGGAVIRQGKGDHVIVQYKGKQEVIPSRTLGKGLQSKIIKWMIQSGLITAVILFLIWAF